MSFSHGTVRRVGSWVEFVQLSEQLSSLNGLVPAYVFRGQSRDWPLLPSLARSLTSLGATSSKFIEIEESLVRRFVQAGHLHLPPALALMSRNGAGWWAIMQHYGVPTRLLDWTSSPMVAAYFAVTGSQPTEDGFIYFFNPSELRSRYRKMYSGSGFTFEADQMPGRHELIDPEAPPIVTFFESTRHLDRSTIQQSVFTLCHQPMQDHAGAIESALKDGTHHEGVMYGKIAIPAALKQEILRQLVSANIHGASLFPGLDGIGRQLAELAMIEIGINGKKNEQSGSIADD